MAAPNWTVADQSRPSAIRAQYQTMLWHTRHVGFQPWQSAMRVLLGRLGYPPATRFQRFLQYVAYAALIVHPRYRKTVSILGLPQWDGVSKTEHAS